MITDEEIVDYLASLWCSQGAGEYMMGHFFANPTGSFREAVGARMKRDRDKRGGEALEFECEKEVRVTNE